MPTQRSAYRRDEPGWLIASVLAGSWRADPPPPDFSSNDLDSVLMRLQETGAAALAWRRIRQSDLATGKTATSLRQAYRAYALQAALHEEQVVWIIGLLRAARIEPMLVKGWSAAQLYPEPGLRPSGDIDVCVRPSEHAAALAALMNSGQLTLAQAPSVGKQETTLTGNADHPCLVELHAGVPDLDRTPEAAFDRSKTVRIVDGEVRVLNPEDNLRMLCVHFLRHGAFRPVWLCDIAALVESLPADFDWDYALSGRKHRSEWVACTIGLAQALLGAAPHPLPLPQLGGGGARGGGRLPRWFVPAVIKQWGRRYTRLDGRLFLSAVRGPGGLLQALKDRWANPVEATVRLEGSFNRLPRFPYQVAEYIARAGLFFRRLPGRMRRRGNRG